MSINYRWNDDDFLPELILSGPELHLSGFNAGDLFQVNLYNNGIIIHHLPESTDLEKRFAEIEQDFYKKSADYVLDNGDIYLAGDYLETTGLNRQRLKIKVTKNVIVIRRETFLFYA